MDDGWAAAEYCCGAGGEYPPAGSCSAAAVLFNLMAGLTPSGERRAGTVGLDSDGPFWPISTRFRNSTLQHREEEGGGSWVSRL